MKNKRKYIKEGNSSEYKEKIYSYTNVFDNSYFIYSA